MAKSRGFLLNRGILEVSFPISIICSFDNYSARDGKEATANKPYRRARKMLKDPPIESKGVIILKSRPTVGCEIGRGTQSVFHRGRESVEESNPF